MDAIGCVCYNSYPVAIYCVTAWGGWVTCNTHILTSCYINIYGYKAIAETENSYVTASTASGYVYSDNSSEYPDQTYTMDDSGDYWWYVRVD